MSAVHGIVLATIRKHKAEAELTLARLESRRRTVPAGQRSSMATLALGKQAAEARAVVAAWTSVEREASA